jgi:hypothetical protein
MVRTLSLSSGAHSRDPVALHTLRTDIDDTAGGVGDPVICPTGNPRMDTMRNLPVAPTCRMQSRLPRRANQNDALAHPAS